MGGLWRVEVTELMFEMITESRAGACSHSNTAQSEILRRIAICQAPDVNNVSAQAIGRVLISQQAAS